MRALVLAMLLCAAYAATGVEPERPVWPAEFQVGAAAAAAAATPCRSALHRPCPSCRAGETLNALPSSCITVRPTGFV